VLLLLLCLRPSSDPFSEFDIVSIAIANFRVAQVFGPEYNFPGNCYSEDLIGNPKLLQSIAKGNGMIGAAEELLMPAERLDSTVAILYPRSSFFWDQEDAELPHGIMGCTNVNMLVTPDYLREVYAIYQSLTTRECYSQQLVLSLA